jgi:glycosyltransferase involved in cell wall biosynthesis
LPVIEEPRISVVIPNRNGSATIDLCLEAAFASEGERFEILVVDDCSEDDSVEKIRRFPCRLITLPRHSGTAVARNTGARHSRGDILFFTDADCLLQSDTLTTTRKALEASGRRTVVGGTYTRQPCDDSFFSTFQSVFINYFETKKNGEPDYIAAHAMALYAETFREEGGFPEDFLPIIEDVEFSHRLRRRGCRLLMNPEITVCHIFNYSPCDSLRNAWRKSRYWAMYSRRNRDLLADSGTASRELKVNVAVSYFCLAAALLLAVSKNTFAGYAILPAFSLNLFMNRGLLKAFFLTKGALFAFGAAVYYFSLYPIAVGAGALSGILSPSGFRLPVEKTS